MYGYEWCIWWYHCWEEKRCIQKRNRQRTHQTSQAHHGVSWRYSYISVNHSSRRWFQSTWNMYLEPNCPVLWVKLSKTLVIGIGILGIHCIYIFYMFSWHGSVSPNRGSKYIKLSKTTTLLVPNAFWGLDIVSTNQLHLLKQNIQIYRTPHAEFAHVHGFFIPRFYPPWSLT